MQQKTKQKYAIRKKRKDFTDIPREVKLEVFRRDNGNCIYCHGYREEYISKNGKIPDSIYSPLPNAHFIPRSKGGLGIEKNIVTLCLLCHHDFDNGKDKIKKDGIKIFIEEYLKEYYGEEWDMDKLIYKKGSVLNGKR